MAEELVEKIRYEADISDIQAKLRTLSDKQDSLASDTERHTGRMGKAWGGVKSALSGGGLWFAGIAGGAAIAIPKILDQGASLDALDKKAATVFSGASLAQVTGWADKVAGSFGVTKTEAVAMAAGMADLLKPMGFTSDQAAAMSTTMGDLSGALSAWTGGSRSAGEVSDILTKAMLGERDGLKELGISISEADVQARLAKNGTADLTGAALEQAKAVATQQLIMEKSTDAQKAWADGSMDSVKKQNESKSSMKQLGETITRLVFPVLEKLVPIIQKIAEWLGEKLPGAFEKVKGFFESVIGGGKRLIEDLAEAFGVSEKTIGIALGAIAAALVAVAIAWNAGPGLIVTAIVALVAGFLWAYENVEWFRTGVQTAFAIVKTAFDIVASAVMWVVEKIQALWDKAEPFRAFMANAFKVGIEVGKLAFEGIRDAAGWVIDKVQALWDKLEPFRAFLADAFAIGIGVGKAAFEGLRDAVGWVWDKLQPLIDKLNDVMEAAKDAWEWVQKLPGLALGGVDLSGAIAKAKSKQGGQFAPGRSHNGGIVPGLPGSERLMLLQAGEQVLTHGQQADSGRVVNIQNLNVTTNDSPRRFYDEGLWRVAG